MNGYDFTEDARRVLATAREESVRLHHEYIGTEHMLLALIRDGDNPGFVTLAALAPDPTRISETIESVVKHGRAAQVGPDLPFTSRAKKVLDLAVAEARELHHSHAGTEHILLGLLREEKGIAARVLEHHGVTLHEVEGEVKRKSGGTSS